MNMILTAMTGNLDVAELEPFFHSLRQCGCKDEVVVFASHISEKCLAMLQKYDAKVINFEYKGIPVLKSRTQRLWQGLKKIGSYYMSHKGEPRDYDHFIINNSRFAHCHNYLNELKEKPQKVLLADIRDVVFQSDPFAFPTPPGLSVALENRKIGQSQMGMKQMFMSVGWRQSKRLAHQNMINCGTILGDYNAIANCLNLYMTYFDRRFFWGLIDAIDQALLNHFAYNELISPVQCYKNWDGPFLTLDSVIVHPENKSTDGFLCNQDGSIIPIVHQYDRIPSLYKRGDVVPSCWEHLIQGTV